MNDPQAVQRWSFTTVTPMGDTHSSYEIRPELLRFETDAVLGETSVDVPWAAVGLGCTAWMQGMGGRGGPDMGRGVPAEMEWLLLSRTDPGATHFMRNLPQGDDRESLLVAVRERLGERWIGEKLALQDAQQRLQISTGGENLKVAGLVLAVMALLVALVILLGLLLHPVVLIPAGFLLGGWLFRGGLQGMRDAITVANTPTARVASAAMGLVELEGRARTANPSPAMITGRPCVWWDVSVKVWYQDSDKRGGQWRQLAARHGGYSGVFELEDDTGRVPVWTDEAMLLLSSEEWESGKQALPAGGMALIEEIGLQWRESGKVRVSETRLEADGEVYVLGTLDERSRVPDHPPTTGISGLLRSLRTGEWKTRLLRAIPARARMVVAVLIGFLSMFGGIGRGGERVRDAETGQAPAIAPAAAMVWKGRGDRPFIISNRRESEALAGLRRQSLWRAGFGVGILCFTLYQSITLFTGG